MKAVIREAKGPKWKMGGGVKEENGERIGREGYGGEGREERGWRGG